MHESKEDAITRYLFWDQEPLHSRTTNETLLKFIEIYGVCRRYIVTSEYQSENVKRIQDTYGFTPLYYFFHGWAALDWYRGYNRSFLMLNPEQRIINKTFISPNRIVGGQRNHRLLMLYHIFKMGMQDNQISCPEICPAENQQTVDIVQSLKHIYSDIDSVFQDQNLPMNFLGEKDHPMDSYRLSLFGPCANSLLYLVTETVATGQRQHLTEKIFKPICLQMPFVIVGTAGSLDYLRRYGFQTFGHIWDESYDHETNDIVRIERIATLLKELDQMTQKEKQQIHKACQGVVKHNYEHFYGGNFEKILWNEMTQLLKDMRV